MDKGGGTDLKVVRSRSGIVPKDFAAAVKDVKLAILQSRARAAHASNVEALKLYFYVGGYVSKKTRTAKLLAHLKAQDYKHIGALPNNFAKTISPMAQATRAVRSFRDEYLLELVNLDNVDAIHDQDVDERVLSKSLVANIEKTIQALGGDDFCVHSKALSFPRPGH